MFESFRKSLNNMFDSLEQPFKEMEEAMTRAVNDGAEVTVTEEKRDGVTVKITRTIRYTKQESKTKE